MLFVTGYEERSSTVTPLFYSHLSQTKEKSAEKSLSSPFSLFKAEFHSINHPMLLVNSFQKRLKRI